MKWIVPNRNYFSKEHHIEMVIKKNTFFKSFEDFMDSVENADVETIDSRKDKAIGYRSRTKSYDDLLSLISDYRSYPKYRNEQTLQNLYDRIRKGSKMNMPIVLEFKDGARRIMSGNTRADIAMQIHGQYKAIIIKV